MLADLWPGAVVVVLLLAVLTAGYWGMFGLPRRKPKYQGRRRVDRGNPDQLRPRALPASTLPPLPCDDVEVIAVGAPLALEAGPRPYRYASRAQHKEPLAEELTR